MYIQIESVPRSLKDNGRFCNWKYKQRGGRQTKVPYIPGTTRRASVDDLSTFTDFETAVSVTGYDGIGICVCGRIMGVDLDHCIENGKPFPWAKEIEDRFSDTYIEISPSGREIRIFCLLPDGFAYDPKTYYIKKGNVEVYVPGHTHCFHTVTGNALNRVDVTEVEDALQWLLDTYMRRPVPSTVPADSS